MWPMAIGAGLQIAGGLFGRKSAKKAAEAQRRLAAEEGAEIERRYGAKSATLRGLADSAPDSSAFKPWNIVSGAGSWEIDPATGQAVQRLSQPLSAAQEWAYGQAAGAREQLGDFDREAFAQREFQDTQALQAEQRAGDMDQLLSSLRRKGLTGFGQTAAGASSSQLTNPMLQSLYKAQADADQGLAIRSRQMADSQMDRLQDRAKGLFNFGTGIDSLLYPQLADQMRLGEQAYDRDVDAWGRRGDMLTSADETDIAAYLAAIGRTSPAEKDVIGARLASNKGIADAMGSFGRRLGAGLFSKK